MTALRPIPSASATPRERLSRFIAVLVRVVAINFIVAGVLALLGGNPSGTAFWIDAVFAQCIGLTIWCFAVLTQDRLALPRLIGLPIAIAFGTPLGWMLASLLLGYPLTRLFRQFQENWAIWFAISALALSANMWAGMNRARLARAEAELALHKAEGDAREREIARSLAIAELSRLQAQLEPHFVFNTLANLRSLIARDPAAAQQLLDRLSDWLRASLRAARAQRTTLGDEFALLGSYLEIQRTRMGGRLEIALDLPDQLAQHSLPPMLLQPLVENAIRHGIEPKPGPGRITLAARRDSDVLHLTVEDSGVGFGAADTGGTGVGLANLRERLAALFGDSAQLVIESPQPGGVRVRLELPSEQT